MAITNTQAWTSNSGTAGSITKAFVNAVSSNSLLVCCADINNRTATLSVSDNVGDSGGTAWAAAKGPTEESSLDQRNYIFWRWVGSGPSGVNKTVTLTASAGTPLLGMFIAEYNGGAGLTFALDGTPTSAIGTNTAAVPDPTAITTSDSGPLIIGFASTIFTMPTAVASWTRRLTGAWNNNDAVEDRIAVASGSYDPSWGGTGSGEFWIAQGAAFKATAASSGRTSKLLTLLGVS